MADVNAELKWHLKNSMLKNATLRAEIKRLRWQRDGLFPWWFRKSVHMGLRKLLLTDGVKFGSYDDLKRFMSPQTIAQVRANRKENQAHGKQEKKNRASASAQSQSTTPQSESRTES